MRGGRGYYRNQYNHRPMNNYRTGSSQYRNNNNRNRNLQNNNSGRNNQGQQSQNQQPVAAN